MITVKLYGDLRKRFNKPINSPGSPNTLEIEPSGITDVNDLLQELQIAGEEVSHIFVNGRYSSVNKKVMNGDRVALFPRNMGLLYKWYFTKEE
ncbi:MAG: MoaD/ThiS family protein [Candidatus Heimdallarchaeota archaeon]|nr:MoaD/ThiS family protein [Candidatus Heimdallarchaeota archaeon]